MNDNHIEECPYHKCKPTTIQYYYNEWNHEWYTYCPKCKENNPTPKKWNRFGYGYTSQYSESQSIKNWNKACVRAAKRLILETLNGNDPFKNVK